MKALAHPLIFSLLLCLSLVGCASRRAVDASYPPPGVVTTKGVGEPLLIQGHGVLVPLMIIPEEQSLGELKIRPGKYASNAQNSEGFWFSGLAISSPTRTEDVVLLSDDKTLCAKPRFADRVCAVLRFSLEKTISDKSRNYFQQTLLYNGKIGDRLTLGYREFSNQIARPAFSNDVTYDLSESSVLGYKGARIEVIKATNTDVTYKVLSGFN